MLTYRPDIDGLRAIAVISVVLFHLDPALLPGGFVGVDIFFVISGYLISKLIFNQLQSNGAFSFSQFYLRRVRRLFPALFATLLLSLMVASQLLAPADLVEFAKSLIAAVLSVSNIFFWSVAGYFDSDSALKPLLHTWSLSIEEQFYFLWPAIMVFLFNQKKAWALPVFILIMAVVSLLLNHFFFAYPVHVASVFGSVDSFDVASTVFYWLPFRVFEFSLGAIVVWLGVLSPTPIHDSDGRNNRLAEILFLFGLLMILVSFWQLDDKQAFPSWRALLPCVGAALIIYSGVGHRLSGLLSNKLMVGVGLISYSLYLVHWPTIVFYKYWRNSVLSHTEMIGLGMFSTVLAYVLYRFIEQPFRKPRAHNKSFVFTVIILTALLVSVSAHAISSGGWLSRYPKEMLAQLSYKHGDYSEYFWRSFHGFEKSFENNSKPKVLIVGDSMAADVTNVLVEGQYADDLDLRSIVIGENCKGVFPLSDEEYRSLFQHRTSVCRAEHQKALDNTALFAQADTVILASYWRENFWHKYIRSTIDYVSSVSDAKILVAGLKDQINNGIWFVSKNAFARNVDSLRTPLDAQSHKVNRLLSANATDYKYFDLASAFCNENGCQRVTRDGFAIIFDQSHLSEKGAQFVASKIANKAWLKSLYQRKDSQPEQLE